MTPRLTEEEEAQSLVGPTFANVTPEMIFSASADAVLAAQVRKLNPKRYRELKQEWLYRSGQARRPLSHWG